MELPQITNCEGCGVCCLHMGYPAYMLPREPATEQQIAEREDLQQLLAVGWTKAELLAGFEGESYWHSMPDELRKEWLEFTAAYESSRAGREDELDDACFWFDMQTRQCKHHEHRPKVCRDFETGSKPCLEWREHYHQLIEEDG